MTTKTMGDEIRTTTHEISKLHRVIEKLKQALDERNNRILAREDEIRGLHAERRRFLRAIDERDERLRLAEEFRKWIDTAQWSRSIHPVSFALWGRPGREATLHELFLKCRDSDHDE